MAAPNMNAPNARVEGKTVVAALTTTATSILANAVDSNKLLRVVSVTLVNVDGTNACLANLWYSVGAVDTLILSTVAVPADANLIAISRDNLLYLEEGAALKGSAGANNDLTVVIAYEEIS